MGETKINNQLIEELDVPPKQLLKIILESIPVAIIVGRCSDNKLLFSNKSMLKVWKHDMYESKSKEQYGEWKGFFPDGQRYKMSDWPLYKTLTNGEEIHDEITIIEKGDGSKGIVSLTSLPIFRDDGVQVGGCVSCEDLTDKEIAIQ
jgi:hypothetical protein